MDKSGKGSFITTMDYRDYPEYFARSQVLLNVDQTVVGQLKFVLTILRAAGGRRVLLLQSSLGNIHPDVLAAMIMGFWRKSRRPAVIMMGCMWQRDAGLPGLMQKIVLRLADRAIFRYLPQSTDEIPIFSATWGIPQNKLRFLPYFYTFTEKDLSAPAPVMDPFIFAGGNSHRDYDAFLAAVDTLPEYKFVIASRLLDGRKLPSNVRTGQVPRTEFVGLMRAASVVVVPIKKGLIRATGQQTYLNAMLLGKPTIITDSPGVRDHVRDGETAIIVDGSPEGYIQAIRRIFDSKQGTQIDHMCKMARESALRNFSFENHCAILLKNIDEVIEAYYAQA